MLRASGEITWYSKFRLNYGGQTILVWGGDGKEAKGEREMRRLVVDS